MSITVVKSEELAQIESNADLLEGKKIGAKIRRYANSFDVNGEGVGSILECQHLPVDGDLLAIIVKPSTTFGTAKLSIGTVDELELYSAAATYTASEIVIPLDHHCNNWQPIIVTSVAALPEDAQLKVDFLVAETR